MFFALCSSFLDCQFTKYFSGNLGYSRKSPNRGEGRGRLRIYFFEENPGIFRFVTLPLEIPDKTSFHPWKFCMQTCMTPLGNPKVENQDQTMAIPHDFFFISPGNSTSFLNDLLEFPHALSSIPLKIPCPHPLCFFLEQPVIWLCNYGMVALEAF